jgi:hypothetical protein
MLLKSVMEPARNKHFFFFFFFFSSLLTCHRRSWEQWLAVVSACGRGEFLPLCCAVLCFDIQQNADKAYEQGMGCDVMTGRKREGEGYRREGVIHVASAAFADEVMQLCLFAGYSVRTTRAGACCGCCCCCRC